MTVSENTDTEYKSFAEFWPFYVCEHSKALTRKFHFVGTSSIIPMVVLVITISPWFLLLLPVSAYGFAWYSHFFIQRNRPATFTYPLWSLIGDFKMFWLMCRGKMDNEVQRCRELLQHN